MNHLTERIAEFVFEEMSASEMANAKRHLTECADCKRDVETFQRTHALLKASLDVEPPRRIIFEVEKPASRSRIWQWLSPAGAAIAASLITAVLMRPAPIGPSQPVQRAVVEQSAPVVQPVDYDRIINEVRASQQAWLASELQKRDVAQGNEIKRVRTELAYLNSIQVGMRRDAIETATLLAQKSEQE